MIKRIFCLLCVAVFLLSCESKKKLVYFQGIENVQSAAKADYQPLLQSDDLLLIIISSPTPEAAIPYNLIAYSASSLQNQDRSGGTGVTYQTYLIDSNGNIEFPILGLIKVGGLTKSDAVEKIKTELKRYILSPIVNLRIVNYKVSVMGEVVRPGMYSVPTERITLPEALSQAGDLTIYGDRKEILIIRDVDGVKTHHFVDITSADFITSPFYYLDQNDIVYVKPNQTKVNSSVVGPNVTVGISAISLLITIIALIAR